VLDRKHIPSNTGDSVEILLVLERSHAALGEVYDLMPATFSAILAGYLGA